MAKILVETTGDFMCFDPTNGNVVEAYGFSEVEDTDFIRNQIGMGRVRFVEKAASPKKAEKSEAAKSYKPTEDLVKE